MNWYNLKETGQFEEIKKISIGKPVLIFKHSTSCMISSMALDRLERKWSESNITPYFLDLITYRDVSNGIEKEFGVRHQSPQAILINDGKVVYQSSHNGIDFDAIRSVADKLEPVIGK